jgi:2',3'-cyclic-nucleotide 2'-phosphodiesterase (5'-nucleotidase family)
LLLKIVLSFFANKAMFKKIIPQVLAVCFFTACTTQQQTTTVTFKDYKIDKQTNRDTGIVTMLMPYSDSINKTMNAVIGFTTRGLTKKQPESELGNFMADCMRIMAEQKFGKKVDAAFINYGGIRSYIAKGEITVGKIYELMPFDNLIVLQDLKGVVFKKFLIKIADRGGWPLSGITMKIKDKKPEQILIDGKPIDDDATYTVANSDYIANGGDDCDMLRDVPQINKGYLLRDALIAFTKQITQQGKPIDWKIEGRVTY